MDISYYNNDINLSWNDIVAGIYLNERDPNLILDASTDSLALANPSITVTS